MQINILEYCDGFSLIAHADDGSVIHDVHIDQEDSVEKMTGLFKSLGINCTYQEVY